MNEIPLSGSTNGQPITISDSMLTVIHTSPVGKTALVHIELFNPTAGAVDITLDVGGVTITGQSRGADTLDPIDVAISNGDAVSIQASATGLSAMGWATVSSFTS